MMHPQATGSRPHNSLAGSPVRERLNMHLRRWLGAWPPRAPYEIVVTPERDRPGWDGKVHPVQGVFSPEGNILAVSPRYKGLFRGADPEELLLDLGASDASNRASRRLGIPVTIGIATLRWSEQAAELPEVGAWVPGGDPRLPGWFAPFHGHALANFNERGGFVAGVGLKNHGQNVLELSVGVDPGHRSRGYARMLVAQAARDVIAGGGIPLYRHERHNVASARVADASGFPDRGWRSVDLDLGDMSP